MPEAALSTAAVTPSAPPVRLHIVRADAAASERAAAPRLSLAPYDLGAALALERELGIGHVLSQVLIRRGIADPAQARAFLYPAEEHPPGAFAGLDVVLTDHHAPRANGELPQDCAIVHPVVCGYPCAELCGTAVAFKLTQALGAPGTEDDLELVALATVADLMPLHGENRRLVRDGLRAMSNTTRLGLRALMTVSRTDPSALDAQALGFRLAPPTNAAGRLARAGAGPA